jgi:sugar transferase (PEP-CTERM/EpsH1 system associated)
MEALLFLVHRIPYPPTKGDKIRSYHILKHLARSYRIHLGAFVDDPADWRYKARLEAMCASVCLLPLRPLQAKLRSLSGLAGNSALSLPYFRKKKMQRWIDSILMRGDVQRLFVYSSPMAQYVTGKKYASIRRVVDFVDVDSDKWRQYALRKSWPLSWLYRREGERLLGFESCVAQTFDASIFVSAAEADLFRRLAPEAAERVCFMDNGVDFTYFSPEHEYENPYGEQSDVLVFTGAMDYWANIDAVRWFALEVFPQVRQTIPSARFVIVGSRPTRDVLQLASLPGVSVTGAVVDIRPYLAHARAAVAPLRIARGVQNKVLEAMAMAKPVLATPSAVEGIEYDNPAGLQVSDSEHQLAEMAIRLLQQDRLQPLRASREWVCQRYDWDINLGRMHELFEGMSDQPVTCPETMQLVADNE